MNCLTLPFGRRAALALAGGVITPAMLAPVAAAQDVLPTRGDPAAGRLLTRQQHGPARAWLAEAMQPRLKRRGPSRGSAQARAAASPPRRWWGGAGRGHARLRRTLAANRPARCPRPADNPRTQLTWIGIVAATPVVLLAAPDHPARDLRSLGEALRARPDTRCGTPGAGTFLHLATVLLMRALGAECKAVHYDDLERAMSLHLQTNGLQLYANQLPVGLAMMREGRARPRRHLARASSARAGGADSGRNRAGLRTRGLGAADRSARHAGGAGGATGARGDGSGARPGRGGAAAGARRRAGRRRRRRVGIHAPGGDAKWAEAVRAVGLAGTR